MPPLSTLALVVAGLAFAAGCSLTDGRPDIPLPAAPLKGSFEPPSPPVAAQSTRYYVDDDGAIWDDRGRRHDTRS